MEIFNSEYFALFVIIAIGIVLGKIKIAGISFGSSAVIFVALAFGHFNIVVSELYQTIGLILFIYSIGIQAGPGFFSAFKNEGLQIISIAAILVFSAAIVTAVSIYVFQVDRNIAVGLLSGALTSTPGLAASIETTGSEMASIGYGVAYPFGIIGVILFMNFAPRLLRVNIKKAELDYESKLKQAHPDILHQHYIVENENIVNKNLASLQIRRMTDATISRIKHNGEVSIPTKDTILHKGDFLRAVGTVDSLEKVQILIGRTTQEDMALEKESEVQWLVVSNKKVVNKTLSQLNIFANYNANITRIRRAGVDILPKPTSVIRYGDKILVACRGNMNALVSLFGNEKSKLAEADILPISAGIVIGVLIGLIPISLPGNIDIKLGLTGGILLTALTLSYLGKTGPIVWTVSSISNQMLRQLGLLFFLASVGTHAGTTLVSTLTSSGLTLFLHGVAMTLIPMFVALILGQWVFKINFITLMGAITGGMTSTPGLTAIESITKSDAANVAYATVYPVAMVVLIICIHILGIL